MIDLFHKLESRLHEGTSSSTNKIRWIYTEHILALARQLGLSTKSHSPHTCTQSELMMMMTSSSTCCLWHYKRKISREGFWLSSLHTHIYTYAYVTYKPNGNDGNHNNSNGNDGIM
jgi:hypothetical protein